MKRKAPSYFKPQGARSSQTNSMFRALSAAKRQRIAQPYVRGLDRIPAGRLTTSGPELKAYDTFAGLTTPAVLNTTGTTQILNIPQQGATFNQRIGNKIQMKSLEFRGEVTRSGNAGTGDPDWYRIMIVYDTQTNGVKPTWSDLITSYGITLGSPNTATSSTALDYLNINNRSRFKVLADITNMVPIGAWDADTNNIANALIDYEGERNIHRFIKLKGLSTIFKASAGTEGDVTTGAIWLMTQGNLAAGEEVADLHWSCRLRYYDM